MDSNCQTYKQLIRGPRITSGIIMLVIWGVFVECYVANFGGQEVTVLTTVALILFLRFTEWFGRIVMMFVRHLLFREKLQKFAGDKFESWQEFHVWLKNATPDEIEAACQRPDDWNPQQAGVDR